MLAHLKDAVCTLVLQHKIFSHVLKKQLPEEEYVIESANVKIMSDMLP